MQRMLKIFLSTILLAFPAFSADPKLLNVQKIWEEAPHNAFTDLARHRGEWYVTFREGEKHVSPDGKLRVITSRDGKNWRSFALIEDPAADLRDPKIKVSPEGKLQLFGAAATDKGHQSMVWDLPSKQGRAIGDFNYWLWNWTWNGKEGLGIGYRTKTEEKGVRLYGTPGFSIRVADLGIEGYSNESQIRFRKDGTAIALLRRDPDVGLRGESKKPYTKWEWTKLDARIGGPNFILLPDGREIAVVRLYDGKTRTSVCEIKDGKVREIVQLPSSGDSSYAGMVVENRILWVSYYSSHEGKTSIYLARLQL